MRLKVVEKPVVAKLIARSRPIGLTEGLLKEGERILSNNSIAGATLDVPIEGTCRPSKTCTKDCYAAYSRQAMPRMLAHQYRVQHSMEADPVAFAQRVMEEYDRLGLTYLRWNGVGDLSEAAVQTINWIGQNRPDATLWVVTRKPELAAKVQHFQNVYVHFSLDSSSLDRREKFLALQPLSRNYFFSYQCERDEIPPANVQASVVFHRKYKLVEGSDPSNPALCPLNLLTDCTGACANCRRCFNGKAVEMSDLPAGLSVRTAFDLADLDRLLQE